MGHKSRGRKSKPRVSVEAAEAELESKDPLTYHAVTAEGRQLIDAIMSAVALLAAGPLESFVPFGGPELPGAADDDDDDAIDAAIAAELDDRLGDELDDELQEVGESQVLGITARVLARAFLAKTLDRSPNVSPPNDLMEPGEDAEAGLSPALIDALAAGLLPPNAPPMDTLPRTARDELYIELRSIVNEIGLEEFDVDCELVLDRKGPRELMSMPVTPDAAHVYLAPYLFERLETFVPGDDVFAAVERDASSWEFATWNVAPPARFGGGDMAAVASKLREQEYTFVERPMVSLGTTPIAAFIEAGSLESILPRQARVAEAYTASVAGIYECIAIDGELVTLRSVSDDSIVRVREHVMPLDYGVGWLFFGRLLPFTEAGIHLRSESMVLVQPSSPDSAAKVADAFERYRQTLPPALAVEAAISSVVYGISVPRPTKPKSSRAHARETIELILEFAEETEWETEVVSALSGTPTVSPDPFTIPRYYTPSKPSIELDATLEGFFAALVEQASAGKTDEDRKRVHKSKRARRRR